MGSDVPVGRLNRNAPAFTSSGLNPSAPAFVPSAEPPKLALYARRPRPRPPTKAPSEEERRPADWQRKAPKRPEVEFTTALTEAPSQAPVWEGRSKAVARQKSKPGISISGKVKEDGNVTMPPVERSEAIQSSEKRPPKKEVKPVKPISKPAEPVKKAPSTPRVAATPSAASQVPTPAPYVPVAATPPAVVPPVAVPTPVVAPPTPPVVVATPPVVVPTPPVVVQPTVVVPTPPVAVQPTAVAPPVVAPPVVPPPVVAPTPVTPTARQAISTPIAGNTVINRQALYVTPLTSLSVEKETRVLERPVATVHTRGPVYERDEMLSLLGSLALSMEQVRPKALLGRLLATVRAAQAARVGVHVTEREPRREPRAEREARPFARREEPRDRLNWRGLRGGTEVTAAMVAAEQDGSWQKGRLQEALAKQRLERLKASSALTPEEKAALELEEKEEAGRRNRKTIIGVLNKLTQENKERCLSELLPALSADTLDFFVEEFIKRACRQHNYIGVFVELISLLKESLRTPTEGSNLGSLLRARTIEGTQKLVKSFCLGMHPPVKLLTMAKDEGVVTTDAGWAMDLYEWKQGFRLFFQGLVKLINALCQAQFISIRVLGDTWNAILWSRARIVSRGTLTQTDIYNNLLAHRPDAHAVTAPADARPVVRYDKEASDERAPMPEATVAGWDFADVKDADLTDILEGHMDALLTLLVHGGRVMDSIIKNSNNAQPTKRALAERLGEFYKSTEKLLDDPLVSYRQKVLLREVLADRADGWRKATATVEAATVTTRAQVKHGAEEPRETRRQHNYAAQSVNKYSEQRGDRGPRPARPAPRTLGGLARAAPEAPEAAPEAGAFKSRATFGALGKGQPLVLTGTATAVGEGVAAWKQLTDAAAGCGTPHGELAQRVVGILRNEGDEPSALVCGYVRRLGLSLAEEHRLCFDLPLAIAERGDCARLYGALHGVLDGGALNAHQAVCAWHALLQGDIQDMRCDAPTVVTAFAAGLDTLATRTTNPKFKNAFQELQTAAQAIPENAI